MKLQYISLSQQHRGPLAGYSAMNAYFLFFRLCFVESSGHHSFMHGILQWERLPGFIQRPLYIDFNKSNEGVGLDENIPDDEEDQRLRALPVFQSF